MPFNQSFLPFNKYIFVSLFFSSTFEETNQRCMKTINFHIALLLGFSLLPAISRSKQIPLRLTENQKLIYEWTAKNRILTPNSVITNEAKTIRYSLLVNKIANDKVFLTAQILKNSTDHSQYPGDFTDVRFPQCAKKYEIPSVDGLSEEVLYQIEFQFELDLNTHTGKLTNRVEILEQSFTILKNKGSSEEIRSKVIELINKRALQEKCDLFLYPFLFLDTDIDQKEIHHQKFGAGFSVVNQNEKQVELKNNAEDGKPVITCIVNKQDGLLSGFIKEITNKSKPGNNYILGIRQTEQLTLLRKSLKKPQQLIVCGHIENPVGDQVELYTLSEPFGNDLDVKNVSLDENKNFRIKTNFENEGFVLVSNLNKNQNVPGPVILLYAEPGDSLYLQAKLVARKFQQETYLRNDSIRITDKDYVVAETISFSGDRRYEAELLNQFWQQSGFMPLLRGRNFFYFNKSGTNAKTYLDALTQLKKLILNFHGKIDNQSITYIEHELQSLLYSVLFSSSIRESIKSVYWPFDAVMLDDDMKYSVQSQLDTLNIYRIYNEYGIFSRELTAKYISYKFHKLSTTVNPRLLISSVYGSRFTDPEQGILLSKLVLNGSLYYREVAKQLYNWALTPHI
ncbi:MAG TPA: hypothetical protein DIW50_01520 [Prolixibacteraceae bacterium]|nr:MAG: hypothetical protein A2W89_23760 [Bacteroidetes bacterium GWE2_42_39]HCR89143.1 hypothetical protein [Prolixibacteraceae bacterium]